MSGFILILLFIIILLVVFILYFTKEDIKKLFLGSAERNIIIHIAGPSGSGKTTLGKQIKAKWPQATVYDLDEILDDLYSYKHFTPAYFVQKVKERTDRLIASANGIIIFVGVLEYYFKGKIGGTSMKADYKYFIDITDQELVDQKWKRDVQGTICQQTCSLDRAYKPKVHVFFDPDNIKRENHAFHQRYKKLKYKIMKFDRIFSEVNSICSNSFLQSINNNKN